MLQKFACIIRCGKVIGLSRSSLILCALYRNEKCNRQAAVTGERYHRSISAIINNDVE